MNLTEMRTLVRRDLRDEDAGSYRWTDSELDRHIAHAVKDFSEALPLERKASLPTTAGSREISLASLADRVMVEAVEYPAGHFPPQYQRFILWQDTLTLLGEEVPDGSDCCLYYGSLHSLDAAGSTLPARYEELIASGACGYAALGWGIYSINRVNLGGTDTPQQWREWGRMKLDHFRSELKRLGRSRRLRVRQLYTPLTAPVSRATDRGPGE